MVKQKKLGLALGAGGWRATAHIGVIKALKHYKINVDYIAGSSAGALVGGMYAAFNNINKVEEIFKENMNRKKLMYAFSDPRPRQGLFKGGKIQKILDTYLEDCQIEDCKIPFVAMTTDLLTGKSVRLTKGSLSKAIRASISVPFFLRPVMWGNKRLIDGATAVPVPVKAVREMGAEVVIAVNLQKNQFPMTQVKASTLQTTFKTSQVMLYHLAHNSQKDADLILYPDIEEHGEYSNPFTPFFKKRNVLESGQKIVKKKIVKIKELLYS